MNKDSQTVSEERKKIGRCLADLRKQKNMTQEELAAELGITKSSVNKMERGIWISIEMIIRLSGILNFKINLVSDR